MNAILNLESWAGKTKHPVLIIKETPKRYKIKFLGESCFHGKFIYGEQYFVPKYSISLNPTPEPK